MVIFPHPDDESFSCGGVLLKAKKLGYKTVVVTLTNGDAGKNYLPNPTERLAKTRIRELGKSIKILHVDTLELGNFSDAKLNVTEKRWSKWLTQIIAKHRPGIIISYDHSGITGHPDHISLSIGLKMIVQAKKLDAKLFYVTFPKKLCKYFTTKTRKYFTEPNYFFNYGVGITKLKSLLVHKSQGFPQNKKLFLFLLYLFLVIHTEWYHEVDLNKKYSYRFVDFSI